MIDLGDLAVLTEEDVIDKFGGTEVTDWSKLYDKECYINIYELRNNRIKWYFAASPHKLLVIDVTKESTTRKICDFLNIPQEFVLDMPHENKT